MVGVFQVVPLGMFAGNINVDLVSGHLLVAGHPYAQSLLNHMQLPHTVRTPSQVHWNRRNISTGNLIQ